MATTRFAPSPTGLLHLGHAHAALFARQAAGVDGTMLLRLEDIDRTRCRAEFARAAMIDLAWLGLDWPEPPRVQSEHLADYAAALARLRPYTYPCFCRRSDLADAAAAPHGLGSIYPGTCHGLAADMAARRMETDEPYAVRLDVAAATAQTGPLTWYEVDRGPVAAAPERLGDVVLARKDIGTSYHLAVTWDDAVQGVDIVTRGEDLREATHIHRLLQALLDLPVPVWHHHPLLVDATGARLAKRTGAPTLAALRAAGLSAAEVRRLAGFNGKIAAQA